MDGTEEHSGALYVYPGTNGPRSSLRFENFRDGIEDYDILVAARELLERLERAHADDRKLEGLRRAISLPDDFVRDSVSYDTEPSRIRERRRLLADALTSAVH